MSKTKEFWISPEDVCTDAYVSEEYLPGLVHVIEKSAYDQLKVELDKERDNFYAELERVLAENKMLKSSDHVRETFKVKEINELRDILQKFYKLNVSNRFPLNGAEKTNEELCTAYEVLVEKNK